MGEVSKTIETEGSYDDKEILEVYNNANMSALESYLSSIKSPVSLGESETGLSLPFTHDLPIHPPLFLLKPLDQVVGSVKSYNQTT